MKRIRFHDVDGDAIGDGADNCPNVASDDLLDVDHDGLGNPCDPDADDDGILGAADNCPLVPNPDQSDRDGDGLGDVCTLPDLIEGLEDVLKNTSAVVEGHVTGVAYTYDEREGPRTNVTLAVDRVHLGSYADSAVELRYLGGPVGDRGFLEPSEQPRFARSGRYVIFLRNTAWFLGPTVVGYVLRVEEAFGREVLTLAHLASRARRQRGRARCAPTASLSARSPGVQRWCGLVLGTDHDGGDLRCDAMILQSL